MSNMVQFVPYTAEMAEEERSELDKNAKASFLKIEVGENVFRFLPAVPGTRPIKIVHEHFVQTGGQKGTKRFACPRQHAKMPCPACDYADALKKSGNPDDQELAGKWYPNTRCYANVIDRNNEERGPQILAFPSGIKKDLDKILAPKGRKKGGDFTNPGPDGFDIIIDREGTGRFDTRYEVAPDPQNTELGNMKWIGDQWDLNKLALVPEYEDIKMCIPRDIRSQLEAPQGGERQLSSGKTSSRKSAGSTRNPKASKDIYNKEVVEVEFDDYDDDEEEEDDAL